MKARIAAALVVLLALAGHAHAKAPSDVVTRFCGDRYCTPVISPGLRQHHHHTRRSKPGRRAVDAFSRLWPDNLGVLPPPARPREALATGGAGKAVETATESWTGTERPAAMPVRVADLVGPARRGMVWIASGSGVRALVSDRSANRFVGLLRDLEAVGYRIKELGGYAWRRIDPRFTGGRRMLSKHARAEALDVNQDGRDVVSVPLSRGLASRLARRWGLCSGGDWRHPDLGHFETCGRKIPAEIRPVRIATAGDAPIVLASVDDGRPTRFDAAGHRGRLSSGRRFDALAMAVAHPTAPIGSCVEVERGGVSVNAKVDDRGPCRSSWCRAHAPARVLARGIDLKPRVASLLGCAGECRVRVRAAPCRGS